MIDITTQKLADKYLVGRTIARVGLQHVESEHHPAATHVGAIWFTDGSSIVLSVAETESEYAVTLSRFPASFKKAEQPEKPQRVTETTAGDKLRPVFTGRGKIHLTTTPSDRRIVGALCGATLGADTGLNWFVGFDGGEQCCQRCEKLRTAHLKEQYAFKPVRPVTAAHLLTHLTRHPRTDATTITLCGLALIRHRPLHWPDTFGYDDKGLCRRCSDRAKTYDPVYLAGQLSWRQRTLLESACGIGIPKAEAAALSSRLLEKNKRSDFWQHAYVASPLGRLVMAEAKKQ